MTSGFCFLKNAGEEHQRDNIIYSVDAIYTPPHAKLSLSGSTQVARAFTENNNSRV
jgi:hypothetical protein